MNLLLLSSLLCTRSLAVDIPADAETLPLVSAATRRGVMTLSFAPPVGEHINEEGPFSATIEVGERPAAELAGTGALLSAGLVLPVGDSDTVWGQAAVPLCEDGGSACRIATVTFEGAVGRRPTPLAIAAPQPPSIAPHLADVEAAFAQARSSGRLVLIDFGAVWCPPCNLLNAEVLEDPEDAAALAPFVLLKVDVDRFDSWPIKDRYAVGGYPTMVLARPDGTEVDRLLGYPGEAEVLAWLRVGPEQTPIGELPEIGAVSPEEAARIARRMIDQDQPALAAPWLEAAAEAPDHVDFRVARLSVTPTISDARWLMDHEVPLMDWVFSALSLTENDPVFAEDLRELLTAELARAAGEDAADLLYGLASLTEDTSLKPALYAASASALKQSLSGEPNLDRGKWWALASRYEQAGQPELAVAVLQNGATLYPEEFTFHYSLGGVLLRKGDDPAAIASLRLARQYGYGDNRLRAARRLAEALRADGQIDEALTVIDEALDVKRPAEEMKVRTPRYLSALEDLREELVAELAAQLP